jgi:hypothetical protein
MNITTFPFIPVIFALLVLLNAYMVKKQGDRYLLPLIVFMLYFSFALSMELSLQYGLIAFTLTIIFGLINRKKIFRKYQA